MTATPQGIDVDREIEIAIGICGFPFWATLCGDQRLVGRIKQLCTRIQEEERQRCAEIADAKLVFHSGHAGDWDNGAARTARDIKRAILASPSADSMKEKR